MTRMASKWADTLLGFAQNTALPVAAIYLLVISFQALWALISPFLVGTVEPPIWQPPAPALVPMEKA